MNAAILVANILIFLAFFVHVIWGDRDIKILELSGEEDKSEKKREVWTMARAAFHIITVDLLCLVIALGVINFSNVISDEKLVLKCIALYLLLCSVSWLVTVTISKKITNNYIKLGQWIVYLLVAGLIYFGIK